MQPKDDPKYVEFKEAVIRYAIDHKLYTGEEHDFLPTQTMLRDEGAKDSKRLSDIYERLVETYGYDKATSCPRFRIRKLTPRECFRLMDVDDTDIDKIFAYRYPDDDCERDCHGAEVVNVESGKRQRHKAGSPISASKCYQLAGNSIVVSCLYHIFKNLFIAPTFSAPVPDGVKVGKGGQLELF